MGSEVAEIKVSRDTVTLDRTLDREMYLSFPERISSKRRSSSSVFTKCYHGTRKTLS